jgi:hypothetical protein
MDGRAMHIGKESNSIEARMRNEPENEDEYLNRYEPMLCGCGCGEIVSGRAHFLNTAHRMRAWRHAVVKSKGAASS